MVIRDAINLLILMRKSMHYLETISRCDSTCLYVPAFMLISTCLCLCSFVCICTYLWCLGSPAPTPALFVCAALICTCHVYVCPPSRWPVFTLFCSWNFTVHPCPPHLSMPGFALIRTCCVYAHPPSHWPAFTLCLASACGTSL